MSTDMRLLAASEVALCIGAPQGEPGGGSFTGDSKRHVEEGFGNGASLIYRGSVR